MRNLGGFFYFEPAERVALEAFARLCDVARGAAGGLTLRAAHVVRCSAVEHEAWVRPHFAVATGARRL
jgi:hypothetical protein